MRKIDVYFLALASLCLVLSVLLGLRMRIAQDFSLTHLNVVGWTSLALFGRTYRAYPVLAQSRLAKAHFLISAPSGTLFPAGLYLLLAHDQPVLTVIAVVWLASAAMYCATLIRFAFTKSLS